MTDLSPSRPASDTDKPTTLSSRRDFLSSTGKAAAASLLAGVSIPAVPAAGSAQIRLALI